MSRHPIVKWAQRSDKVYVTVDLPDAKDVKVKLEPDGRFNFSAKKDEIPYEVDLDLFDKVNVEDSKYNVGVRNIVYVIKKAEKKWWDRLIKPEGKPPVFVKVDWDKWVDEEEENERAGMDFDDMDFSMKSKRKKRMGRKRWRWENRLHRWLRKLSLDCFGKTENGDPYP
ncbi:co-chaperone protein p23-1-like isoform X4 [Prosopis cineraria]|uniref:co-chaperone protein p23-1-like isoform X4 n=1 Tax=Prosopis cineraria TaxID=364024 RepID=UPI00240E9F20|nr:co-chaperone protein p23-1-like isoform X4 [Prosopis cineraria]XP_054816448.1 co-chaperone protein p23-1-like isoform X4 [Prosopis cineraria]